MRRTVLALTVLVLVMGILGAAQGRRGRGQRPAPDPRTAGGGQCANNEYNCIDTPNPLPEADTVWIEEMTWMDVRDAMAAGKKTVIISTGGIEPNGPWLALGKHNYVLRANCDAIARTLGDALCAPIIPLVPEGNHEPASGHMATVGTISMRQETFEAMLTDVATSFKAHGFENIIFIGDSGGNQSGQAAVAESLNAAWNASPVVAHIADYYDYGSVNRYLVEQGVLPEERPADGLHDDPVISMNMMMTDPESVRHSARVEAGKATINGVSLADLDRALEIGKMIVEFRARVTADAIRKATAR